MKRYNPKEIEPTWQKWWDEQGTYKADLQSKKPTYIAMSMFNYPSGAGLHIGHAMNYTISDVKARFKRQLGHESYHPVGWDSFGLPAENYAIKAGISPQQSMASIIPNYQKQYKAMGWSNDWSKEIATHTPEYYKWTQWIFSQMYKHGLAYQDARMQWWCETCQTVLANEQVIDDKCWRHDNPEDPVVQKKEVKQWFFKITEYADELLEATDSLDWTESVKLAQKNWIGRSNGAEITFAVENSKHAVTVFTTRPDTLFGATFLVLAPEHELVQHITTSDKKAEVEAYIQDAQKKTDIERQASKDKTGVCTGAYATNPINQEKIPIWIADYVLMGYGTGAIMAVPAHDERDNEFAKKYDLLVKEVVAPEFGTILPDAVDVTGPVIIGYDPSKKLYMSLINTKNNMRWFASGGLEEGESYEEAAHRELREEAGFSDVKALLQLGGPTYSYYFNTNKKSNRRSFSYIYLAIIDFDHQGDQSLEAHENYKVEWSSLDIIMQDLKKEPDGRDHWIDGLQRAELSVAAYEAGKTYTPPCYTGEGVLFDSEEYSGMRSSIAREQIIAQLVDRGEATEKVNYKMRDWSVSRQRYWGAPIPIINCEKCGTVLVEDGQLPVVLPELKDFQPSGDGRSALARATEWLKIDCPQCGGPAERETDTLDTYIDSSWYMFRYFDPFNTEKIFDSDVVNKWTPIDFYNGGDHATAHLLYARFIARFFHKIGLVDNPEPFKQMLFNGKVTAADGTMFSKRKGNGVDPLEIIEQGYGADALRTYLMFAAPLELWAKWDPQGVPGTYRFLNRIWVLVQEYLVAEPIELHEQQQADIRRSTHRMIQKCTDDINANRYNTAIAALMTCVNELYKLKETSLGVHPVWHTGLSNLVACVAPFAPHIAEDLWHQLGHDSSVQADSWPTYEQSYIDTDTITIVLQVNGKVRAELQVPVSSTQEELKQLALNHERIQEYTVGKEILKTIVVPKKLVNVVVL